MQNTLQQIFDKIDRLAGTNSQSYTDAEKTQDLNGFIAELEVEAGFSDSSNQWDDPRYDNTDGGRPVNTVDLELNQKVYSFYKDADDNRILSLYKIVYFDNEGGECELVEGEDYDIYGHNIELTFKPKARVSGEDKNVLYIYFTRQGLGFVAAETSAESPFPAAFDNYLIYMCSAQWCIAESEDPSMRAKADRWTVEAEKKKPMFKKWVQRYHKVTTPRITGRTNNLK